MPLASLCNLTLCHLSSLHSNQADFSIFIILIKFPSGDLIFPRIGWPAISAMKLNFFLERESAMNLYLLIGCSFYEAKDHAVTGLALKSSFSSLSVLNSPLLLALCFMYDFESGIVEGQAEIVVCLRWPALCGGKAWAACTCVPSPWLPPRRLSTHTPLPCYCSQVPVFPRLWSS